LIDAAQNALDRAGHDATPQNAMEPWRMGLASTVQHVASWISDG
jgi:hypothetical protein